MLQECIVLCLLFWCYAFNEIISVSTFHVSDNWCASNIEPRYRKVSTGEHFTIRMRGMPLCPMFYCFVAFVVFRKQFTNINVITEPKMPSQQLFFFSAACALWPTRLMLASLLFAKWRSFIAYAATKIFAKHFYFHRFSFLFLFSFLAIARSVFWSDTLAFT